MSIGDQATAQRVLGDSGLEEPAPLSHAVADIVLTELTAALQARGYDVASAVGQSGFRCDLAIRQPTDRAYRLGILVDTDEYYRQDDILERDVLKPRLLRAFGWRVAHVLTKDWHDNRKAVLDGLERTLSGGGDEAAESDSEIAESATPAGPPTSKPVAVAEPAARAEENAPAVAAILPASAAKEWPRSFEFIEGGSRKFWEISVSGARHTVRFGRIGSAGQSKTKDFPDPAAAERDARRLINEKLAKGYVEKRES
jgi:predicted DNA-binding WGR domain protein